MIREHVDHRNEIGSVVLIRVSDEHQARDPEAGTAQQCPIRRNGIRCWGTVETGNGCTSPDCVRNSVE